jgi:hypothetical protein
MGFEPPRQIGDHGAARALERRHWLRAFVALFGVLSFGPPFGVRESWSEEAHLEKWLRLFSVDFLGDGAALSHLGAIYLASNPGERNRKRLSRLLSGDGTNPVGLSLIENVARDWLEHDVAVVEGWVLARTEARICAVLHIMDGALV